MSLNKEFYFDFHSLVAILKDFIAYFTFVNHGEIYVKNHLHSHTQYIKYTKKNKNSKNNNPCLIITELPPMSTMLKSDNFGK